MFSTIIVKTSIGDLHLRIESLPTNTGEKGSAYVDEQLVADDADNFFIQQRIRDAISDFNSCWRVNSFCHNDERGSTRILIERARVLSP